jgi:hypothetical protein
MTWATPSVMTCQRGEGRLRPHHHRNLNPHGHESDAATATKQERRRRQQQHLHHRRWRTVARERQEVLEGEEEKMTHGAHL